MSKSEVERFVRDIKADPALLTDMRRHASLAAAAAVAAQRGYDFTAEELQAAVVAGKELSRTELDAAVGGTDNPIGIWWDQLVPGVKY